MELQAPIVPVPDTSSLQYVTKGLASMISQRQYNQQLELAYQKMAQDTLIDQQKVDLTRQQLAQQLPLQQAQIENMHAEANQHNAMAGYYENYKSQKIKDDQELLGRVTEYNKAAAERMAGKFGTTEGANELGLLDAEYPDIVNIKQGWQSRNANLTKQAREERNSISVLSNLRKNMDDTARKGLGQWANNPILAASPDQLEYDPVRKEFKPNNVWGVNKGSNDPYITVQGQTAANGQWLGWKIVPPSETSKAKDTQTVTLPKSLAESYIQQRDAFRTKASGLAGPPPSTVQAVQQQAQMGGSRMDLAREALSDPLATPEEKAAAQRILSSGQ